MKSLLEILSRVALIIIYGNFAILHFNAFMETEKLVYILYMSMETILVFFFVIRKISESFSTKPIDWFYALAGTFLPLFVQPSSAGIGDEIGAFIAWAGILILTLPAIISLNRSFGLVPANRGIKTSGMYQFLRHPIYASYLFVWIGYLVSNLSMYNAILLTISAYLMIMRIFKEEAHLLQSDEYKTYASQVKWRLIPYVF